MSLIVMAVFLLSFVPASLADHDKEDEHDVVSISAGGVKVVASEGRVEVRDGIRDIKATTASNVKEKKDDVRVDVKDGKDAVRIRVKDGKTDIRTKINDKKTEVRTDIKDRKTEIKQKFEDRRQANIDNLKDMDPKKLRKIEALSAVSIDRISNVDSEKREKISALKKERLERVSHLDKEKLERISDLKKEHLEKIADLDKDKLRKIAHLDKVKLEKIANLDAKKIDKIAKLSRAKQKEIAGLDKAQIAKRLDKIKVKSVRKADDLKLRVISKQKADIAKKRFSDARKKYEDAKERYADARAKYLEAKDARDEEGKIEHAKEVLLRSAESIIGHLEKIKSKVEESENIEEDKANDLIGRIDNQISEVESIKSDIKAAETAEEIREAAKSLKGKWNNIKHKAKAFAERVVTARIQGVVHQGQVLEKKLDKALARMEEAGIEADVDSKVEEFSNLIAEANDKFKQAKTKFDAAKDETDRDAVKELVDEGKVLVDESRQALRLSHDKLRDIVEKIRDAGHELEIDEDESVDVEEEDGAGDDVIVAGASADEPTSINITGTCVDEDGNPAPQPNDGVGVCRGHDGSDNDYVWSGPGPDAESEYCGSNPQVDNVPCSYRCPTGERVNPETNRCGPYPPTTSAGTCVDEDGNPAPQPNDGVGVCRGHDGSDNDYVWSGPGPDAESEYCGSNPQVDNVPCSYRCPTGERVNPETNRCGPYPPTTSAGTCVDEDGTLSTHPTSSRYEGDLTNCPDTPDLEPGSTTQWTYDADCSNGLSCTFQCGDNRVLNDENYCEYCSNGFSANALKNACVCNGVVENMGTFESCSPCQGDMVPNADNSACVCGSGLYYSTQYNYCMSRESCVGGDDLIVDDSTRECITCTGDTVPDNTHTACVCAPGLYLESEYNSCWSYETCEGADNMQADSSSVPWTCDRI